MKTSFYFVLWILVYPILGIMNIDVINDNSFIFALITVLGISWLIRNIIGAILHHDQKVVGSTILEEIYTGNIDAFKKRLKTDIVVSTMSSIYLCLFAIFALNITLTTANNEIFTLIIFAFLGIGSVSETIKKHRAYKDLVYDPSIEQCAETADEIYKLNYTAYYEIRQTCSKNQLLTPSPKGYKAFQVISIIFAMAAIVLGMVVLSQGVFLILGESDFALHTLTGIFFLYGSLAIYFGIKDIYTISYSVKTRKN